MKSLPATDRTPARSPASQPTSDGALALAQSPQPQPESSPRNDEGAQVVELRRSEPAPEASRPEEDREPSEPRRSTATHGPTTGRHAALTPVTGSHQKPPVLASEALRRELAPAEPAADNSRAAIVLIGLLGAAACVVGSAASGLGLTLGGALLTVAVLGMVPMPYPGRAVALIVLAGAGFGIACIEQASTLGGISAIALAVAVAVLSSALLFRSWHRASLLARALSALGITLCAGWMWVGRTLGSLTVLQADWQAWLPPVLQLPFAMLLMLSLLAFMDGRSTGGCSIWAGSLLCWHGLYTWSLLIAEIWPKGASAPDLRLVPVATMVSYLASPLLVTVLAIGVAQVLASANSFERDS